MNILLAVDVQPEFNNDDAWYSKIVSYIKHAKENGYDRVYATVCGNSKNGSFVRYSISMPTGSTTRTYTDFGKENTLTWAGIICTPLSATIPVPAL